MYEPDVGDLLDEVLEGAWTGVPVRAMEALLATGASAVPAIMEEVELNCAEETADDADYGLVYLLVVLGELRDGRAAPLLGRAIEWAADNPVVAGAAADALARLGGAALPELQRLFASDVEQHRYWAYYAAGRSGAPEAVSPLLAALDTDPGLADVLALALIDAGAEHAIEPLYRALQRAEPWQQADIEGAIQDLHAGRREPPDDWRFRYRSGPVGRIPPTWAVLAAYMRNDADLRSQRIGGPLRPLEEILRGPDPEPAETCDCCGVPTETLTGIAVCPKTAQLVPTLQAGQILKAADHEDVDIFELLSGVEADLEQAREARDRKQRRSRAARERLEDDMTRLQLLNAGVLWAARQGAQTAGEAARLLLEQARAAVRRHGDREGAAGTIAALEHELEHGGDRPAPAADPFAGVGRNDPCPCGSGRKFKKCHGGLQGGGPPRLVTSDDEPVSFARAHYVATDRAAVIAALDACPDLDRAEDADRVRYDWPEQIGPSEWRRLGTIELRAPDRVLLECLSRSRLDRGKALLERVAGRWLVHRSDTEQDPWQAVAAAQASPRFRNSARDDVPPEIAGPAMHQIMDNFYRTWPDEPLPALAGRSAREAVRDARGRAAVVALLRSFDEGERLKPEPLRYDFGWIWKELGIEAERRRPTSV